MRPKPLNFDNASIAKIATQLAGHLEFVTGGDIKSVVADLGGKILHRHFWWDDDNRSLEIRGENDFTIWLPTYTGRERDRLLLGHDLGHYFLHFLWPLRNNPEDKIELPLSFNYFEADKQLDHEAHVFSANFLAPADKFRKLWKKHNGDIWLVAGALGMSGWFVARRAEGLGLKEIEKDTPAAA